MSHEVFYSRFPLWILWLAIAGSALNLVYELGSFVVRGGGLAWINAGCMAFALVVFLSARRNRLREPAVEVSDEAVEYGFLFRLFFARRRIPLEEIEALLPAKRGRIELRLRSGRQVGIPLLEVARPEREAVRAAIARRISG